MLSVCDQIVFLQAALGNGEIHGIPWGDILVRRLWAAGHLAACLKKVSGARSKNRGSSSKPQRDIHFKARHARGRDGASG